MAISYEGIGSVVSGAGAITPTLPAGLADDDLLIAIFETANQAITLSGWTEITDSPQGTGTAGAAGAVRLTSFYKFYTTGDGNPTSSDSGNHQIGRIFAFRGVDTSAPFEDTAGATAAASNIQNLPDVTTVTAGAMAVYLVADDRDLATSGTQFRDTEWLSPNVDSGACTEICDEFTSTGVGGGIGAAYATVTTPATLSGATFQHAGANSFANGMMAVVLKPASGAADQDIDPSLLTNSQAFYAPTVTSEVQLSPSLFTNTNLFFGPTIATGAVYVLPPLLTNAQALYAATVSQASGTQMLAPSLFTNSNAFYAPTVTRTYQLAPTLLSNGQTFYSASVTIDQVLSPSLFTNAQTFYAHQVSGGVLPVFVGQGFVRNFAGGFAA